MFHVSPGLFLCRLFMIRAGALENLKEAKVFAGIRGAPAADIDALAEMAARICAE
jgi:hypothetical protein